MASASVFQDEFNCSICLDLLNDPVTVPCGHSFCLNCITGCWDQEDHKGVYSCPQCRETFTPRPVLRKNTMMAEVVGKLKKIQLQPKAAYAGPDDVECDLCTGRKYKAIKSCLTCLISYCEDHIQPHYEVARLRKHKLVNATSQLQDRICSQHDKVTEVFCRSDQKLICMLCSMDHHKGHLTFSAAAERTEKQRYMLQMKGSIQGQIQQREWEVEAVKQAVNSLQGSAQKAVEDTERIFTELISFLEEKRSEVTESIRAQERAEVHRAEGLLEQLKLEIAKLKNRDAVIEQLKPVEDPIDFIQIFQKHLTSVANTLPSVKFCPQFSVSKVMRSVAPSLKEKTQKFHQAVLKVTGFMTGDRVKLKNPEVITKTCEKDSHVSYDSYNSYHRCPYKHKYNITINCMGVVTGCQEFRDSLTIDFPEHSGWRGTSSQLELVFAIDACSPSSSL